MDVTGDPDCPTDAAVAADAHAPGDTRACGNRSMRADPHVVTDLNLVVELDAFFDDGVVYRAAIDRRVRADLDVGPDMHAADLRHLHPMIAGVGKTKTVGAYHAS
jgi:hypothetical protein